MGGGARLCALIPGGERKGNERKGKGREGGVDETIDYFKCLLRVLASSPQSSSPLHIISSSMVCMSRLLSADVSTSRLSSVVVVVVVVA